MTKKKFQIVPASAEQVALYGHIAARLRQEMDKRNWKVADVNTAIGRRPENSALYVWLASKGAPGVEARELLSKVLKIPEADLMPREENGRALVKMERVKTPKQPKVASIEPPPPPHARDVLNFSINNEGQARIRCDVTLPATKGAALLSVLLNAGLVMEPDDAP